jgi:hypothetical protein
LDRRAWQFWLARWVRAIASRALDGALWQKKARFHADFIINLVMENLAFFPKFQE